MMFQKLLNINSDDSKIDWGKSKKQKLKELLEKEGCYKCEINEPNVKEKIMKITENCKKGNLPNLEDLNLIFNNLKHLDHFDCVRTDQTITRIYNSRENNYQWASVCMNQKWKIL